MSLESASTAKVDYLQRSGMTPVFTASAITAGARSTRRLLRVRGIGRPEKELDRQLAVTGWRPPTTSLITGLYGYRIPLVFLIAGSTHGVAFHLGTWSGRDAPGEIQDRRASVIASVVKGLYPVVDLEPGGEPQTVWPLGGMALGVHAPSGIDGSDGGAPIDRIVRSLTGTTWQVLVLAYPAAEDAIGEVRSSILNEMRAVSAAAKNEGAPSPLTQQYTDLLDSGLMSMSEGMATGAWRTAIYLLGDGDSYPRLASAWRSVMSGVESLPEPVRVFDDPSVGALARDWGLPDQRGVPGPGLYRRPFECQTLLSTSQLAAVVHLPELEAPGFTITQVPRFDTVAVKRSDNGTGVTIGRVLHNRQETAGTYEVSLASLTRHAFVGGLTGSGKTNTILSLLEGASAQNVPFLVIEPTKTEYRGLVEHPAIGPRMRVFTAGNAMVAPFVLNPFEVPPGTTVSQHLDLIRAAFAAAFGMWTPLPQILERCLHEVYLDRGWDLRTNRNGRLADGDDRSAAFPTLSDLIAKVGEVIPKLGYDDKVTGDMRAALVTRLESLRRGGKGAMLDSARSLPSEELFGYPTVMELEAMGDEGDKAFLTGLILIRLAEHRRAMGQSKGLVHLLVVEEAHRLLGNVPHVASEESANPRGQAVETFSNLLSEIRAYGQGVVIADQVPVRLAPDVMKNTNLKIAHRIVSEDDRDALAGAMAMDARQSRALTALEVGEAAVFSGGDDAPLLVRIPLAKARLPDAPPPDERVFAQMQSRREERGLASLFQPQPFCAETCATPDVCEAARGIANDEFVQRTLSRVVVSSIDEPGAIDRLWDDLTGVVRARRPPSMAEEALLRSFAGHGSDWLASRRGAQGMWTFAETAEFRDRLRGVLLDKLAGAPNGPAWRAAFVETARRLHARQFEPYPACHVVCAQVPPLCLYRAPLADLIATRRYRDAWLDADATDIADETNRRRATWEVCQDAAFEAIEFPEQDQSEESRERLDIAARRACLCFEQQMLAADDRKVPRTSRRILDRVITESGI